LAKPETADLEGRIIAHLGTRVRVKTAQGVVEVKPPRKAGWAVGDIAVIRDGRGVEIRERKNELTRVGGNGEKQTLAANVDLVVAVTACGEAFKLGLIDRFCVTALRMGADFSIALNKMDMEGSDRQLMEAKAYETLGIPVHPVSARTGEGMEAFAESLSGRICALLGHSGVGKTSILNQLAPGVNRPVGELLGKTEQGRHTTTMSLLVELASGGAIIDSPGLRQFSPADIEARDVAEFFPGIRDFSGSCKFRDCVHLTEPGCCVTTALADGRLGAERYASYARLLESIRENGARRARG
jgi:ribosome biogenesis GTPase